MRKSRKSREFDEQTNGLVTLLDRPYGPLGRNIPVRKQTERRDGNDFVPKCIGTKIKACLHTAQRYSVGLMPNFFRGLANFNRLDIVRPGEGYQQKNFFHPH